MARLSIRDQAKPLILITAVAVGLFLQQAIGHGLSGLSLFTEIGVFVVITAVMLPVEIRDVGAAFKKVRPTIMALVVNFLFIPIFSWVLGYLLLHRYPDFWVGAILYTLTPCIGWYLIFTDLAEGDVPWGIALLPWNITLQVLLMPLYLYFLIGKVIPLDLAVLLRSIVLFLLSPFVVAHLMQRWMIRRQGKSFFERKIKPLAGQIKLWGLVLVIISMFASQNPVDISQLGSLALLIVFLIGFFLLLFALALVLGRLAGLSYAETTTLAFTTTARNSEAVIGVAMAAFPGHPLVLMAIILGPVIELPLLLLIARSMLVLKEKW